MRYLFVTVDSAGALYPQIALALRMQARGHSVRFLGCRSQREAITRAGLPVSVYSGSPDFDMRDPNCVIRDWSDDPHTAFQACCDHIWFGPAAAVAHDVLVESGREPVDAVVIDYFAFGAAVAAEKLGIPSVVLWHTAFGEWAAWNHGLRDLNSAREGLGLPADGSVYDAYRRAARILVLTTERFGAAAGGAKILPANVRHVGPQLPPGDEPGASPRRTNRDKPSVLVSIGTSYQAQEDLLHRLVAALETLPVTALVTSGPAISVEFRSSAAVEVRKWIDHTKVLPGIDLVITHAGMGTIMNAMAFGVPLLCLPMGRDQHGNAEAVNRLGLGVTADPVSEVHELRRAIIGALAESVYAVRARELAEETAVRPGWDAASVELEVAAATANVSH
jgi:UDP:flavonoid glycosyltransferase YjiC (YdhE family)